MENIALVDNDFMHKIASLSMDDKEWMTLMKKFFEELNCTAGVHSLVYTHEMLDESAPELGKKRIKELVKLKTLLIQDLPTLLADDNLRIYYKHVFEEISNDFLGQVPVTDIYVEWKHGHSLGEIHSISMCILFEFGIFLSE